MPQDILTFTWDGMNILTNHNLTEIILIGILAAQILILLRMTKRDDAYRRRQRRKRIDKIMSKVKRA